MREAVRCIGWRIGSDPIPSRARFRADNRTLPGTALVAGNKYRYRSARRPDEHIGLDSIHVSEVIGSVDATLGRLKSLPDAIGLNAATSILDGDAALSHDVVYIPRMVMPRTRGLADRCFERPGAVHQARLTNVRVMVGQALIFPAHLQIRDSALNTSTIAQGSRCLFPRIHYLSRSTRAHRHIGSRDTPTPNARKGRSSVRPLHKRLARPYDNQGICSSCQQNSVGAQVFVAHGVQEPAVFGIEIKEISRLNCTVNNGDRRRFSSQVATTD